MLLILYTVFIQPYLEFGIFRFFSVNLKRSLPFNSKSALLKCLNKRTQACFGRHCHHNFPQIYYDFHSRFSFDKWTKKKKETCRTCFLFGSKLNMFIIRKKIGFNSKLFKNPWRFENYNHSSISWKYVTQLKSEFYFYKKVIFKIFHF